MAGIKYKINDKFDINFDFGYNYVLNDNIDAIKFGDQKDNYITVSVGFSIRIWNQRDSDNDGINDDVDKCPYEEEDIDGFEDEDGCPDIDNDGDGIIDFKDGCQNIAEDLDGYMDEDGCPDPDNDGDGILDLDDACPDVAEDFDGFEDEDGCPDADNDGDGILDNRLINVLMKLKYLMDSKMKMAVQMNYQNQFMLNRLLKLLKKLPQKKR